jgi:hypothetical protein
MSSSMAVLFTKYYSGDEIMKDEMDRACSIHGGDDVCMKFWFGSPEEKRAFIRPRHIQADDIKMDVKEIG